MKNKTKPAIRPNAIIWEHANSFRDAALLCRKNSLAQPMAVNAALAIELYLKCFLALNVIQADSSNMGFSSEHGHVLTELLEKLRTSDKNLLFDQLAQVNSEVAWEELFSKYDDTFIKVRYWYETGNEIPINPEIVDFAVNIGEAVLRSGKVKYC